MPFYDEDGRISAEALAVLYGHPTFVLQEMLETNESFIQYALVKGWLEDIPDKEQVNSAIKSELGRRGAFD